MLDEQRHEIRAAFQIPVAPTSRAARDSPIGGVRFPGLGIAPIRIDTNTAGTEFLGISLFVEPDHEPTKRIGTNVKAQAIGPFAKLGHRSSP